MTWHRFMPWWWLFGVRITSSSIQSVFFSYVCALFCSRRSVDTVRSVEVQMSVKQSNVCAVTQAVIVTVGTREISSDPHDNPSMDGRVLSTSLRWAFSAFSIAEITLRYYNAAGRGSRRKPQHWCQSGVTHFMTFFRLEMTIGTCLSRCICDSWRDVASCCLSQVLFFSKSGNARTTRCHTSGMLMHLKIMNQIDHSSSETKSPR